MLESEALRLKDRGEKKAKSLRIHGEAEDIGQHVVCEMLENGRGQTVDECVIDYYRHNYGRRSAKNFDLRQRLAKAVSSPYDDELTPDRAITPFDAIAFHQRLQKLKPYQRGVIALRFLWGFTQSEIGEIFGLTPEAIRSTFKYAVEGIEID